MRPRNSPDLKINTVCIGVCCNYREKVFICFIFMCVCVCVCVLGAVLGDILLRLYNLRPQNNAVFVVVCCNYKEKA